MVSQIKNRHVRNRMRGGVRGRKTKVGRKLLRFPPTRFYIFPISIFRYLSVWLIFKVQLIPGL